MKNTCYPAAPASPLLSGISRNGDDTVFVFSAPEEAVVELCLFRDTEPEPFQVIALTEAFRTGSVRAVAVTLPEEERFTYLYRVDGAYITDPRSPALRECRTGKHVLLRGAVPAPVHLSATLPVIPFEDCVFYKLHVRGFSMRRRSGLQHPGTFAGITESIPYFQELGVNALLLMPVYEFFEVPHVPAYAADRAEQNRRHTRHNYWGYAKGWYCTPRRAYSSSESANGEFAAMVDALHRAGILCLLEFYFEENEDPRLVTDVLRHWLLTYHVDGFHLVGDGGWLAAVRRDPLLSDTHLLFAHEEENTSLPVGGSSRKRIGVYNNAYGQCLRRFLKGDLDVSTEEVAWMQRRNAVTFAWLSYLADQDGFTLADAVSYEERHNESNGEENRDGAAANFTWNCGEEGPTRRAAVRKLREQQLRNAFLLLLTAQSTPLIYAGDESGNSQSGNNNAWCQDNKDGWVTWSRSRASTALFDFVKAAIAFRRQHPVLHRAEPLRMVDYRSCGLPDLSYHSGSAWLQQSFQMKAAFGALYGGNYAEREDGTADETLYVLYNMYWKEQAFALPDPPAGTAWFLKADTSMDSVFYADGREPAVQSVDKCVPVPARTIRILIALGPDGGH